MRGLQAHGVAATAKHYVANDSETNRFTVDVRVDERTLHELYLAPFEQLVVEGGAWLVMAAYNSVNGITMTENPLLRDPLKTDWGFNGVVVSDWWAARSTEPSRPGMCSSTAMPIDRLATDSGSHDSKAAGQGPMSSRDYAETVGHIPTGTCSA